ncbi:MAG: hypothetical protein ACFCAD_17660, partial [Pleurocapsa sp.]
QLCWLKFNPHPGFTLMGGILRGGAGLFVLELVSAKDNELVKGNKTKKMHKLKNNLGNNTGMLCIYFD